MTDSELVLALETSGPAGSVALLTADGGTLAEEALIGYGRNASSLLPAVDRALRSCATCIADVRLICFSQGPGSFTGLRVAATFARMVQAVNGCDVVGVPTLAAIASNADALETTCDRLLVMLDAKAGHAFVAEYRRRRGAAGGGANGGTAGWEESAAVAMRPVEAIVASVDAATLLVGAAAERHRTALEARGASIGDPNLGVPTARQVGVLGRTRCAAGQILAPHDILPLYIRPPEAEEVYESRRAAARTRRGE